MLTFKKNVCISFFFTSEVRGLLDTEIVRLESVYELARFHCIHLGTPVHQGMMISKIKYRRQVENSIGSIVGLKLIIHVIRSSKFRRWIKPGSWV